MHHDWLTQLASQHSAQLRSYLSRFTSSKADIDDWIQESLLRVFAAGKNRELDDPVAYLFRTARNVALKRLSHRKVKYLAAAQVEQLTLTRFKSEPLHQILQVRKDIANLFSVLADLPERCREVFMLCKLEGYSYSETAEQLGISVSTVEKHMVKALRLSRAALMSDQHATQIDESMPTERIDFGSVGQKS